MRFTSAVDQIVQAHDARLQSQAVPDHTRVLEQKAMAVGNNRAALKKRLTEARSCLVTDLRKRFGKGTFDFENKRLVSDDGTFALQWLLRKYPDRPVCYDNQQTSVGSIIVVSLAG